MATLANALTFARTQAQTDSNGLTDANGIVWANEALFDFHRRLIAAGVDASQVQETYRDGAVATAGNGSAFLYPTDMWWLKAIELNYSDTTAANYKTATQLDVANLPNNQSFGWYRINASPTDPYFDDRGDWFEVFPAFTSAHNISQAIRIFYYLKPTEYTATSDTIAYPESLDYRILGWRIAGSYLYSQGTTIGSGRNVRLTGDVYFSKYDEHVKQLISTLTRGSQQPIQATPIQLTGFEF